MDAERSSLVRHIIELAKDGLANRSALTHAAMRAEYMSAIYSAEMPSSMSQIRLDRVLSNIGKAAADTERQIANKTTNEIFDMVGEVETPNMVSDLLTFQNDVAKQVSRDAQAISSLFQQVQVSVNRLTTTDRVLAKAQALKHVGGPKVFTYKDKVGKIWKSEVYLKTHSSQYYYNLTNDLVLGGLYGEGRKTATMDRPGHKTDGLEIALTEIGAVQSKYFHPGSQAILI